MPHATNSIFAELALGVSHKTLICSLGHADKTDTGKSTMYIHYMRSWLYLISRPAPAVRPIRSPSYLWILTMNNVSALRPSFEVNAKSLSKSYDTSGCQMCPVCLRLLTTSCLLTSHSCMLDIVGARFHCAICDSVDICSNCESAGLPGNLDSSDDGHNSSHIMIKVCTTIFFDIFIDT